MIDKIDKMRKELNDKLNELEKEIKQQQVKEDDGAWIPKDNQRYYVPDPTKDAFATKYIWSNTSHFCTLMHKSRLLYKTLEGAAEAGKRMYYREWFSRLSDVTKEMWKDDTMKKSYAHYNWIMEEVEYAMCLWCMNGNAYFTSKEKLSEAIETIGGEDIFKRYVLGVVVE